VVSSQHSWILSISENGSKDKTLLSGLGTIEVDVSRVFIERSDGKRIEYRAPPPMDKIDETAKKALITHSVTYIWLEIFLTLGMEILSLGLLPGIGRKSGLASQYTRSNFCIAKDVGVLGSIDLTISDP
jgi:hypothetical protein